MIMLSIQVLGRMLESVTNTKTSSLPRLEDEYDFFSLMKVKGDVVYNEIHYCPIFFQLAVARK